MPSVSDLQLDILQNTPVASYEQLFTDGTLVAANGNAASSWIRVDKYSKIMVTKTSTGGAYALEFDWSRDGTSSDITETISVSNNTSIEKSVAAKYARFRVKNTDGAAAFTAHRTIIGGGR